MGQMETMPDDALDAYALNLGTIADQAMSVGDAAIPLVAVAGMLDVLVILGNRTLGPFPAAFTDHVEQAAGLAADDVAAARTDGVAPPLVDHLDAAVTRTRTAIAAWRQTF